MRALLMAGFALTFTACVHSTALQSLNGKHVGKATIAFEGNSSGKLTIERNGIIYRGPWAASKIDESANIAKIYGMHSQRYQNYQRGLGDYQRLGKSTLLSEQGNVLNCEFKYRGSTAQGWCKSDVEQFEFVAAS